MTNTTAPQPPMPAIGVALGLLPPGMDTPAARVLMLAIGYQESGFAHRRQIRGPARGYWQFEKTGVAGVIQHRASRWHASAICAAREVDFTVTAVHRRLEHDDVLAAGIARLLLWTDPAPLPDPQDADAAWAYYLRNWRPGKPHPARWPANHARALAALSITGD